MPVTIYLYSKLSTIHPTAKVSEHDGTTFNPYIYPQTLHPQIQEFYLFLTPDVSILFKSLRTYCDRGDN